MGIHESQLETWSHQGSITHSATTYGTIKRALEANDAGYANRKFEVFLQGSYGNNTNIYSESDVDVVIRLTSSFWHDLSKLPPEQQQLFHATLPDGDYQYTTFKSHVEAVLTKAFGDSVKPGSRAFKIEESGARRNADVVVAFAYRRYYRFNGVADQSFDEGIKFLTSSGEGIVNSSKAALHKSYDETSGDGRDVQTACEDSQEHAKPHGGVKHVWCRDCAVVFSRRIALQCAKGTVCWQLHRRPHGFD